MKNIILDTLFFLVAITAHAQLTNWQNISSNNFVMKIIHDQNYLYVGTKGGGIVKINKQSGEQTVLKRADGSMTGNSITDMALHNGELWVGTEFNGIAKVTDGGMEKFDKKNAGFQINQHFSGFYFKDDGTMLVGSIAYLYAFDGKKCTEAYDINLLSPYTYVKKIKADIDGRIWVACYDALNQYNLCVLTSNELMPYNIHYGKANTIETDKDGCLWIATNNGLVKCDGNDFTHYTPENSALPEVNIMEMTADEKGNATQQANFICHKALYGQEKRHHTTKYEDDSTALTGKNLIYTPDVVVFKSDLRTDPVYPQMLSRDEWYKVNVITCAAPVMVRVFILPDNYETVIRSRIKKILDVAAKERNDVVILGAWGCGAFKNPIGIVARVFVELVKNYQFEIVEFAIATRNDVRSSAFARALQEFK